jgi:hypothetical protein
LRPLDAWFENCLHSRILISRKEQSQRFQNGPSRGRDLDANNRALNVEIGHDTGHLALTGYGRLRETEVEGVHVAVVGPVHHPRSSRPCPHLIEVFDGLPHDL